MANLGVILKMVYSCNISDSSEIEIWKEMKNLDGLYIEISSIQAIREMSHSRYLGGQFKINRRDIAEYNLLT